MALRVLIVDDDALARTVLARVLEGIGHEVALHDSAFGTTALIQSGKPDVVVIDVNLPGLSGAQLVEFANRRTPGSPEAEAAPLFILYSGMEAAELRALGVKSGAAGVLPKALGRRALASEFERIVSG